MAMTGMLKRFLFTILGREQYLRALQRSFFALYDLGLLKTDPVYKYHYFVKKLIRPGDTVVDLGANLGYFSTIFARLVKTGGHVVSIEPVKPFFSVLKKQLSQFSQCRLYNYALGTESGTIQMAVPKNYGYLRTGLAHVADENNNAHSDFLFEVQMVKGSALLSGLNSIHYIKCDIEGYEEFVLPEMRYLLDQHKPILQVETWGTHKAVVMDLITSLGYKVYTLHEKKLLEITPSENGYPGDYLFVHPANSDRIKGL